jgi:hypothetical protein
VRETARTPGEDLHAAQRAKRHLPRGLLVLLAIEDLES